MPGPASEKETGDFGESGVIPEGWVGYRPARREAPTTMHHLKPPATSLAPGTQPTPVSDLLAFVHGPTHHPGSRLP